MKILVVEDDLVTRKVIQKILERMENIDVDVAEDGIVGLEKFSKMLKEEEKYRIICLDVMMPKMGGQEVLQNMRKLEKENNILEKEKAKIIMMTALSDLENIKKAYTEECDEYLVKPVKITELKELIKKHSI